MRQDYADLEPPPYPSEDRIQHAVSIISRLVEVEALVGWKAHFHRHNLECVGVYRSALAL